MAKYHEDDFATVAKAYAFDGRKTVDTATTLGLGSYIGLNSTQLERLRSWLRDTQGLILQHNQQERKRIADEVCLRDETQPIVGEYELETSEKEVEVCPYWYANTQEDVCSEIEMHDLEMILCHQNNQESSPFETKSKGKM